MKTYKTNDYELIKLNNEREEGLGYFVVIVFIIIVLAPIILGPICALMLYFGN